MATDDEATVVSWFCDRFGADGSRFPIGAAGLPAPDAAMFDDDRHAAGLRRTSEEGLRQGVAGFALDRLVRSRPWTFDAGAIDVACELIHGEQDTVVPIKFQQQLAASYAGNVSTFEIPNADHEAPVPPELAERYVEWIKTLGEIVAAS